MSIRRAVGKPTLIRRSRFHPSLAIHYAGAMRLSPLLVVCVLFGNASALLANGGAWPTGVPSTGNAAPSDKARATELAIGEENLTIDLHQEFAQVEVRYRMKNTGPKVVQDFFFPVERWRAEDAGDEGEGAKPKDLENYSIKADGADLKWKTIDVPVPKIAGEAATPAETATPDATPESSAPETEEQSENEPQPFEVPNDLLPPSKHWKKSEIPFAADQTREIVIRYRVRYSGYSRYVSEDGHETDELFLYSLSPAATWKGPIGHGKIAINVLHPRPEEMQIEKPKEQFRKVSDVRYEWEFRDLEPTLADDIKLIARRGFDSYDAQNHAEGEENQPAREYVFQGDRYFLEHGDYKPIATSTLKPSGKHRYDVDTIRRMEPDQAWCEGVDGDGIGESITFDVARPLPLEAIMIRPGYVSLENPSLWTKNNRVAELEVTLNDEHTFTTKIPDEQFEDPYPIVVRDYAAPAKTIKLVIKAVHRGTAARDTCISEIRLKGKLATKPQVHPAR